MENKVFVSKVIYVVRVHSHVGSIIPTSVSDFLKHFTDKEVKKDVEEEKVISVC